MTKHPITPPHELVQQWSVSSPIQHSGESWAYELFIAHQAAQWGADQELEACCIWITREKSVLMAEELGIARRPKPPSLKEHALETLHSMQIEPCMINGVNTIADLMAKYDILRRALEALPND